MSTFSCKLDEKDSSENLNQKGMYRKQRPPHVVLLKLPAQYGSEALLKKINEYSRKANWKIHVSHEKQNDYLCTKGRIKYFLHSQHKVPILGLILCPGNN